MKFSDFLGGETSNTYARLLNKSFDNEIRLHELFQVMQHLQVQYPENRNGHYVVNKQKLPVKEFLS